MVEHTVPLVSITTPHDLIKVSIHIYIGKNHMNSVQWSCDVILLVFHPFLAPISQVFSFLESHLLHLSYQLRTKDKTELLPTNLIACS